MENSIKRSDFKYNFLKKVILRIDYTGILDTDLEETVKRLKNLLYKNGFINFWESYISEVDFEIKDPELIETQLAIPINELKKNKAYSFATEDLQQTIQITKYFTFINVDFGNYIKFERFGKVFTEIVDIIKGKNKFMRVLRLGLRKINNCILLDINNLNKFFDEKYFNNIVQEFYIEQLKIDLMNSEKIDSFNINGNNVNLIRHLSQGILQTNNEEKEAYQVVLDIDVYIKDKDIFDSILGNNEILYKKLININTLLFKIYIQMLKKDFIRKLQTSGVDENLILGVKKND